MATGRLGPGLPRPPPLPRGRATLLFRGADEAWSPAVP